MNILWTTFLIVLALISAESRVQKHHGLTIGQGVEVPERHPYLFLNVPRGRSDPVYRGFKVIQEAEDDEIANDEDEMENADEDLDEYEQHVGGKVQAGSIKASLVKEDFEENESNDDDQNAEEHTDTKTKKKTSDSQMVMENAKPSQMMVSNENGGALIVPDEIIEIEGQSIVDEKTGKVSLLIPQAVLDAIPDGSIVAVMERSTADLADDEEEERANRVIVRRRRLGSRRNVRRRGNGNVYRRRVNGNGNRRRRVNRRTNIRVIRPNNLRRQQVNRRRVNRPIIYQV